MAEIKKILFYPDHLDSTANGIDSKAHGIIEALIKQFPNHEVIISEPYEEINAVIESNKPTIEGIILKKDFEGDSNLGHMLAVGFAEKMNNSVPIIAYGDLTWTTAAEDPEGHYIYMAHSEKLSSIKEFSKDVAERLDELITERKNKPLIETPKHKIELLPEDLEKETILLVENNIFPYAIETTRKITYGLRENFSDKNIMLVNNYRDALGVLNSHETNRIVAAISNTEIFHNRRDYKNAEGKTLPPEQCNLSSLKDHGSTLYFNIRNGEGYISYNKLYNLPRDLPVVLYYPNYSKKSSLPGWAFDEDNNAIAVNADPEKKRNIFPDNIIKFLKEKFEERGISIVPQEKTPEPEKKAGKIQPSKYTPRAIMERGLAERKELYLRDSKKLFTYRSPF